MSTPIPECGHCGRTPYHASDCPHAGEPWPPATEQGETAKRWSWTECIAKAPMEIAELLNNREAQVALLKAENERLKAPDLSALWGLVDRWRTVAESVIETVNNGQAPVSDADVARSWLASAQALQFKLEELGIPRPEGTR